MADTFSIYDFTLQETVNGHKLISLSHNTDNWSFGGTWSGSIGPKADGSYDLTQFRLGHGINFQNMSNAILLAISPVKGGGYNISGADAGRWLNKPAPPPNSISATTTNGVIRELAELCGISVVGTGGITGVDARSLVTAGSVSEVIIELCQLSGLIPYIGDDGKLNLITPALSTISYPDSMIIEDGGTALDLDNFALGVAITVYRRKKTQAEKTGTPTPTGPFIRGQTPSASLTRETYSAGGNSFTIIMPLNVPERVVTHTDETINISGVAGSSLRIVTDTEEEYDYDTDSRTYWEINEVFAMQTHQDNREHRVFEYALTGYTKTTTVKKYVTGTVTMNTQEVTTETMARTLDFDKRVTRETYRKKTTRTLLSGTLPPPVDGAPPYDATFDEDTVTTYSRHILSGINWGDVLEISTKKKTNETQEVGEYASVSTLGTDAVSGETKWVPALYTMGAAGPVQLCVRMNASIQWVERLQAITVTEYMDENGVVRMTTTVESDDEGSTYRNAKGWIPLDDAADTAEELEKKLIQRCYQSFSEYGVQTSVDVNQSGTPSDIILETLDLPGRERYYGTEGSSISINANEWYNPSTGGYVVTSGPCPHYNGGKCSIYKISVVWDYTDEKCPYPNGRGFVSCPRAQAALEEARSQDENGEFEPPILCTAGDINSGVVYTRNVYIRDFLTEAQARSIGDQMAANLLTIKGARGIRRTITIPLDLTKHIDGTIIGLQHDYKNMKTQMTYRISGDVPALRNIDSPVSMSLSVTDRERNRNTRNVYGTVYSIDTQTKRVLVSVGTALIECSTRVVYLAEGDAVWVSLVAGNTMDGTIIERVG
jgi:hypothetical protein